MILFFLKRIKWLNGLKKLDLSVLFFKLNYGLGYYIFDFGLILDDEWIVYLYNRVVKEVNWDGDLNVI